MYAARSLQEICWWQRPGARRRVDFIAMGLHSYSKLPIVLERAELVELDGGRWILQAPLVSQALSQVSQAPVLGCLVVAL